MSNDAPAWKIYERLVASFEVEAADMDASVTPNATLLGSISGAQRQIDVLVDARWDDGLSRRIIFDAKRRSRKVDVTDVEAFEGLMRDVRASRGVLVCTKAYSEAAEKRAQKSINIRLLDEDEALEIDHAAVDPCPRCRAEKRKPEGLVFWDGQLPLPVGPAWAIIFSGKCDVCRSFAFWCWACGDKNVVPDDTDHECGCEWHWSQNEQPMKSPSSSRSRTVKFPWIEGRSADLERPSLSLRWRLILGRTDQPLVLTIGKASVFPWLGIRHSLRL